MNSSDSLYKSFNIITKKEAIFCQEFGFYATDVYANFL